MKYTVKNRYGISGESNHRSFKAAVTARRRHEGAGWEIFDADGNRIEPYYLPIAGGGWEAVPEIVY